MKAIIYSRSGWLYGQFSSGCLSDLERLLHEAGFTILNSIDHQFSPMGYTKLWLLGESHFAFHSFPEENVAYVELSSCVKEKAVLFWQDVEAWAQTNNINTKITPLHILISTE